MPIPVRLSAIVTTDASQILLIQPNEHAMPGEEKAIQVDDFGAIDVDSGIIKESVYGARVLGCVELRWLLHQAFDGIYICLSGWSCHLVKVLTDLHLLLCAWRPLLPMSALPGCRSWWEISRKGAYA
jgi:hypothetical protein